MQYCYSLHEKYSTIVPEADCLDDMMAWARRHPEMYECYTVGWIVYRDASALAWLRLRWGV